MDPRIWGRSMWRSLLNIVKGAPETLSAKQRRSYELFFTSLGDILPCERCKVNYKKHLAELPPITDSRKQMLAWLHAIHNKVLLELNKNPITLENFLDKYDNNEYDTYNYLLCIMVLLGIVVGLYYLYRKRNN